VVNRFKGTASQPPTSLTGQLLFRDMYFGAQAAMGYSFTQTVNNSHIRFIPWHLPTKLDPETGKTTGTYQVDSPKAEEYFLRWREGQTGFPWIDALMRQLKTEGWIHHLGRHAVACFLTRGGCYIDWERGADVFEEWLIDHETACNAGNWQWLSCTAFFSQFYRMYSPIAFPKKTDPEGDFVRRFCPELKNYSKKFIYEPWKAPIADQKAWGCVIKGDGSETEQKEGGYKVYPKPMFDFPEQREICLRGMKKAYAVGLQGDNPKVLDGTWRELFGDDAEGPTEGTEGPIGAMVGKEHVEVDDEGDVKKSNGKGKVKLESGEEKGKKGTTSKAGLKRGPSQGTLDSMVVRKKKNA
jgi:cryptochrome